MLLYMQSSQSQFGLSLITHTHFVEFLKKGICASTHICTNLKYQHMDITGNSYSVTFYFVVKPTNTKHNNLFPANNRISQQLQHFATCINQIMASSTHCFNPLVLPFTLFLLLTLALFTLLVTVLETLFFMFTISPSL